MRLKLSEFKIPEQDPFKNDKLERKQVADSLTILVQNIKMPFVIGIDSSWGSGKTTFIKMWRQLLVKNNIPSVYYNAWENDFSSSALISLLGEIDKGLDELKISTSRRKKLESKFDGAKKIGVELVKKGAPVALKVLTSGVLDANKAIETAIAEFSEAYSKDLIEKYEKSKNSIIAFRNKLAEFIKETTKGNTKFAGKPFIIFIDELDRCRPNFALEILEKAKHLFNIDSIIFILSFEREHLGNSIKTIYGNEMNVDGYLRRFFDLIYRLPEANAENYCTYLFSVYNIQQYFSDRRHSPHDYDNLRTILTRFFGIMKFSLRTQEQIFTQFVICLLSINKDIKMSAILIGILLCLKSSNAKLYYKFVNKEANAEDVIKYLNSFSESYKIFDEIIGFIIEGYLIAITPEINQQGEENFPLLNKYEQEAIDDPESIPKKDKLRRIKDIVNSDEMWNRQHVFQDVIKRLELIENIESENLRLLKQ